MKMSENNNKNHPIWDVYDSYRSARFYAKYYKERLNKFKNYNYLIEISIAVSAPTSAIAGLWLWDTPLGIDIWRVLGVITAVFAVLKPILRLSDRIRKTEKIISEFRELEHDLKWISILVKQNNCYDKKTQDLFQKAHQKKGRIIKLEFETKIDKKLKIKCQDEVLQELPVDSFYIPES